VTAGKLTMMKNTVDPMATQSGVLAALLAEKGYTGPEHVIDGKEGLVHCLRSGVEAEPADRWTGRVLAYHTVRDEIFPDRGADHAPISAVLDWSRATTCIPTGGEDSDPFAGARRGHSFRSQQVRSAHQGNGRPFAALRDCGGAGGPAGDAAQFEMKKIMDPTIRAQLKKVEVVADPEIEKVFPALQRVIVNITTTDGRTFSKQLDYPKGRSAKSAERRGN
jgi:2-methylcitrate dehydratase